MISSHQLFLAHRHRCQHLAKPRPAGKWMALGFAGLALAAGVAARFVFLP